MNKINKIMAFVALTTSCFAVSATESITPYIIGGEKAKVEDFKSYVQIRMQEYDYDPSSHYQSCGGSIINNQFVLTAAHCLTEKVVYDLEETDPAYNHDPNAADYENKYSISENKNIEHIKVVVKNTNQHDVHMSELKEVEAIFIPDAYYDRNAHASDVDIAIVKLKYPIKVEDNVSQINLVQDGDESIYDVELPLLELVGLGVNRQDYDESGNLISQSSPEHLQYSKVQLLSDTYTYNSAELDNGASKYSFSCYSDLNNKLCVTHPGFVEDQPISDDDLGAACRGDSGGPLYWNHNGTQKQVGVVSSGAGNCSDIAGNYFTEIEYYLPWINGVLSTESTPDTANLSGYDPLLDDGNTHSEGDHGFIADPITDGDTGGDGDTGSGNGNTGGGSGGGSTGLFTLLGLGLLGLQRRKNK